MHIELITKILAFRKKQQARLNNTEEIDSKSNCLGYAFYALGISPQDRVRWDNINILLNIYFDQVKTLKEADAIAAISDNNQERRFGKDPIWNFSHIAVVTKQKLGYVTERAATGEQIRMVTIKEAFQEYFSPNNTKNHELIYLKLKPKKKITHT